MSRPAVELAASARPTAKATRERVVLRDVSVAIAPGEIAVLVGRSGSGKSTLLNLIAGIDRPTSGPRARRRHRPHRARRARAHALSPPPHRLRLPVLQPDPRCSPSRRTCCCRLELNGRADAAGARGRARCSSAWASPTARRASRTGCPAASSSGWPSRARWSTTPRWSSPTSPPATSTRRRRRPCSALLDALARESGKTVVMVTHSREVVGAADRIFAVQRGRLVEQPAPASRRRRMIRPLARIARPAPRAAPVAARPRRARHRARRGRGGVHRPRQRERAARLRARHRGRDGARDPSDRGRPVRRSPRRSTATLRLDLGAPRGGAGGDGRRRRARPPRPHLHRARRRSVRRGAVPAVPGGARGPEADGPGRRASRSPAWRRSSRGRARCSWRARRRATSGSRGATGSPCASPGARRVLTVAGLLEPADPVSARALDGLLVTDIATAQEIVGARGAPEPHRPPHRR